MHACVSPGFLWVGGAENTSKINTIMTFLGPKVRDRRIRDNGTCNHDVKLFCLCQTLTLNIMALKGSGQVV